MVLGHWTLFLLFKRLTITELMIRNILAEYSNFKIRDCSVGPLVSYKEVT